MKVAALFTLLGVILLAGCSKAQFGQPIPAHVQAVKLADILKDPASYKDREVVLEGNYGYYCCPDDFSYREGLEGIEVAPVGFASPKAERGRPIRIYGVVRVGEKRREEHEEEQKEEGEHHDFFIEAKGVQFK